MQTIVLTRENNSIPWGFRLKGGYEYNVPLSILKVNEGSPSYNLLECGDVLVNIGKYSALNMKHEEALNIIRMFDLSIQLVVQRDTTSRSNLKASSAVWRPPSLASQQFSPQQPTTPSYSSNSYSNFNFNNYSTPSSNDYSAHATNYYSDSETSSPYTTSRQYAYSSAQSVSPQIVPTQVPPPPAPPLPATFQSHYREEKQLEEENFIGSNNDVFDNSLYSQSANKSYGSETNISTLGNPVPDRLLKALNTPSASGRKPFTYTPGGLDLSHVRQSARVKRFEQQESQREQQQQLQQQIGSNYAFESQYSSQNQYQSPSSQYSSHSQYQSPPYSNPSQYSSPSYQQTQSYSPASQYQSPLATPSYQAHPPFSSQYSSPSTYSSNQASSTLSSYLAAASTAAPSSPSISAYTAPSSSIGSYSAPMSSTPTNSSGNSYGTSYVMPKSSYTPPSKQNQPGFVVKPEQLLNRNKKDETTQKNQSYSFKMLNKWIANSESNDTLMKSKKDEAQKSAEEAEKAAQKSAVARAIEDEEKRRRSPQRAFEPASNAESNQPINFQQLKANPKAYQKVNNDHESNLETHARPRSYEVEHQSPRTLARERDQEGDAPHYKGSAIPSRTFRYLQHLTEDETAMMESMQNENHKAQQHHQQQRQQHHQQQHQSAHTSYSNNSVTFENQYSERDDPASSKTVVEHHHQQKQHQAAHASYSASHHEQTEASSHEVNQETREESQSESVYHDQSHSLSAQKGAVVKQFSLENEPAEEPHLRETSEQASLEEPVQEEEIAIYIPSGNAEIEVNESTEVEQHNGEADAEPTTAELSGDVIEPPECTSDF